MGVIYNNIKMRGSLGEKKVESLFDSGASDSMINRELAITLEIPSKLPDPLSYETVKEGEKLVVTERVALDFYIDGIRFSDEFLILENLSESVIIGASTMQKWRMLLNFEEDRVIVDQRVTKKILK